MVDGCYKMSKNKSFKKLAADRDAKMVEIIDYTKLNNILIVKLGKL